MVVPHGSNASSGPLGPYRFSQGTPRTVPHRPVHYTGVIGSALSDPNGALGSMALFGPGGRVP